MISLQVGPCFSPGRIVITPAAARALARDEVATALRRHLRGDWGELSPADRRENARSLAEGGRLLSVYQTRTGVRFYVLTEADRATTTLLLPEDY